MSYPSLDNRKLNWIAGLVFFGVVVGIPLLIAVILVVK